jgi:hypothetical protein
MEIAGGVNADQAVILVGKRSLSDGQAVKVMEAR